MGNPNVIIITHANTLERIQQWSNVDHVFIPSVGDELGVEAVLYKVVRRRYEFLLNEDKQVYGTMVNLLVIPSA